MNFSKKRRYLYLMMLLAFQLLKLPQHLWSQVPEKELFLLSSRVGAELDSIEIEYFNVFPNLDQVKGAVFREDNLGNIRFLISLANGKDTTMVMSKLAGKELGKLIDHFEKIPNNPNLVNWNILPGFFQGKFNYFESSGRKISLRTEEGQFTGRFLMASDSAICLWLRKGDFEPDNCNEFIKRISYSKIKSLKVQPGFSTKIFGASVGAGLALSLVHLRQNLIHPEKDFEFENSPIILGIGCIIGAAGGYFFDGINALKPWKQVDGEIQQYRMILPQVQKLAMFNRIYPPELAAFR